MSKQYVRSIIKYLKTWVNLVGPIDENIRLLVTAFCFKQNLAYLQRRAFVAGE